MPTNNPLIIALDTPSSLTALKLVNRLKVTGVAFKVGYELFCSVGPKIVERLVNHHVRVFLDLKYHDIPNTVAQAARVATQMGVWMFNVHTSGGSDMMRAASEASREVAAQQKINAPILLGVTVLTSLASIEEINVKVPIADQVIHLAGLAKKSGLDGVVCSGVEAPKLREKLGSDFCLVTPGIRPAGSEVGDQKRVLTPKDALAAGSNYLVVGRPVTESKTPLKAVDQILTSLSLEGRGSG